MSLCGEGFALLKQLLCLITCTPHCSEASWIPTHVIQNIFIKQEISIVVPLCLSLSGFLTEGNERWQNQQFSAVFSQQHFPQNVNVSILAGRWTEPAGSHSLERNQLWKVSTAGVVSGPSLSKWVHYHSFFANCQSVLKSLQIRMLKRINKVSADMFSVLTGIFQKYCSNSQCYIIIKQSKEAADLWN